MKKFATLLAACLLLFTKIILAQEQPTSVEAIVNNIIKKEKVNLPKMNFLLFADSSSISASVAKIYFNTQQSFKKGDLPADFIEMLPEILLPITQKIATAQLLLFAREATTNEWKTLDYFSNQPLTPIYTPTPNSDAYPATKGNNNPLLTRVFPTTGSALPTGTLSGKTVWLSPGHGWHNTGSGYTTQRGTSNEIVEDFTTAESIDYYLMGYLYNAGANVWSVRERDVNSAEIIVNNDVPASGYSETGTWTNGSIAGYGGTYRVTTASATENATAVFVPNVTQSGLYWVSVRCIAGSNRATDVAYTIIHSGDTSIIKVNQEIHSDTWVYVGQFYFTSGGLNKITLSNKSAEVGQAIIADAVRLGGGIGAEPDCINTTQGVSNRSRFEESARQYARFQGYPTCTEDVTVRPKYSEYELAKGTPAELANAIYVAWHTNAFDGAAKGTETYSYNGLGSGRPNITAGSVELRNFIHNQIVADIRAVWKPSWTDRGVKTANFGELRELNSIPGILMELAFHDFVDDAADLKHPEFRRLAARSIYKGILKFFNNRDGVPLVYLPEQPTRVAVKNIGSNNLQINWAAPITGGIYGSAATGYKIYVSTNGKSFKDGIAVTGTSYTFNGSAQTNYYFKVTATNAGGESFSSSVIAARTPVPGNTNIPYLIVDAFDRIDADAMIPRVESGPLGTVKRMFLDRMNRYDYMIEHAQALASCNNIAFDGCQNEAVAAGTVLLSTYPAVDWYTGEESTLDFSVDATERSLIKAYLNAGGNLLISGSEIGWDVGRPASLNADLDFYNNYLKAAFIGDDANTYNFSGTTGFFTAQNGVFDNSTNGYYDVDFPDRIASNGGSSIALNYSGGTADGAAVGYKGLFNMLYFAFPFEAITSAAVRTNLMCNAVAYLTPSVLPATGLTIAGTNNGPTNKINWKTIAELNIKEMFVQRSNNGIMFNDISQPFAPKGSWNNGANYSFEDNNILPIGYYRIKVIDADGKMSVSNTILLKNTKPTNLFSVINNPAKGSIRLVIWANTPSSLMLINSMGQTVEKKMVTTSNGTVLTFNSTHLSKGMYSVVMTNGIKQQAEKIIVE